MMPRTLSSGVTFWMKVVFPLLWIGGFTVGTIASFLEMFRDRVGEPPPPAIGLILLLVTILGAAFLYWWCMRLKRVRLDEEALYVSNYLREIRVPLHQVEDVSENRWINLHPVFIEFRGETGFGPRIVFMPKIRWFSFFRSHPAVAEIGEAVARARGERSGGRRTS